MNIHGQRYSARHVNPIDALLVSPMASRSIDNPGSSGWPYRHIALNRVLRQIGRLSHFLLIDAWKRLRDFQPITLFRLMRCIIKRPLARE